MADSNAAIDSMVADIDSASDHMDLLSCIWMPDNNGTRMAEVSGCQGYHLPRHGR